MSENQLDGLKKQLADELALPETNYDEVVRLSAAIARFDEKRVRFTVDAGHISRLGRELVERRETAVSELIKNAYDADATTVSMTFIDAYKPGGRLIIEDNGHGMNREQLINGFMRLSSTEKVREPISPRYKRLRAGRKGIGRFAAQRLGSKLTVLTKTAAAREAFKLSIDWSDFVGDRNLTELSSELQFSPFSNEHGTMLIIEGLEEGWSDASLKRIFRYIADLIQPFPISENTQHLLNDPGFDTKINRLDDGEKSEIASVEKLIYEFALAKIEAVIGVDGEAVWSIESQQLEIEDIAEPISATDSGINVKFSQLRNVYLRAYYYIFNANFIPRNQNSIIRDLALERGGIRVYRNGYRVLPYGEPYDDWLKLQESSVRRRILPPHANYNFFGFVEITDPEGQYFEETASREGLLQNEAFTELTNVVSRILKASALRVAAKRNRKRKASQSDWESKEPDEILADTASALELIAGQLESSIAVVDSESLAGEAGLDGMSRELIVKDLRESVEQIRSASQANEDAKLQLADKLTLLRVLASLGQAIGEFTHEIRHLLPNMRLTVEHFAQTLSSEEERSRARMLLSNIKNFSSLASYFHRAASEHSRREMIIQELGVVTRRFHKDIATSTFDRYDIVIHTPIVSGYDLFTVQMHPAELQSILLNLFTNSRKAIERNGGSGNIQISVGRAETAHVYLRFADDGDGIADDIADRIFDPFFSTNTPPNPDASDLDAAKGSGLGLSIVSEIVEGYNGTIELTEPPSGYATCFQILLPAASTEEIDAYGY